MASLIESVVSLESQASQIVEAAHAQAKEIEGGVKAELRAQRSGIEEETSRRIEAFRAEAESRHNNEMAAAEGDFDAACHLIEGLDVQSVRKQIDLIIARFREL